MHDYDENSSPTGAKTIFRAPKNHSTRISTRCIYYFCIVKTCTCRELNSLSNDGFSFFIPVEQGSGGAHQHVVTTSWKIKWSPPQKWLPPCPKNLPTVAKVVSTPFKKCSHCGQSGFHIGQEIPLTGQNIFFSNTLPLCPVTAAQQGSTLATWPPVRTGKKLKIALHLDKMIFRQF